MRILNTLLDIKIKQHLIYFVIVLIVVLLADNGFYWALLSLIMFPFRFPRSYLFYFLAGMIFFLRLPSSPEVEENLSKNVLNFEASVIRVRHQTSERQAAIINKNGKSIYMTFFEESPKIKPGDIIKIDGILMVPESRRVPHAFDFRGFLENQNIHYTLRADGLAIIDSQFSLWRYQYELTEWVGNRFPLLTAAYIQTLFLGQLQNIDSHMRETWSDLGLLHIFAISGLHVGLLGGIFSYFLKRCGVIEEIACYLVIVFIISFTIIAGGSPSVVRAASMMTGGILNKQFKLGFSSLDIFSAVLLFNFIFIPHQIYQTGFIFSYWLTFVLISSKSIMKSLQSWQLYFFLPFLAQLSALPLTLFFNHEMNIFSYLANLIIVPIVTWIIIPFLMAVLFIPSLSILSEFILQIFESFNSIFANHFHLNWVVGDLGLPVTSLLFIIFIGGCVIFERCRKWQVWPLTIIALILTAEIGRWWQPQSTLWFVDVGQGDAMVIQSPFHSCTIVVDTGGQFLIGGEKRPIFSRTLEPFLVGEGVREIDFLILSHGDFDHIGEARELMDRFVVKNVVIGEGEITGYFERVLKHAQTKGIPVLTATTLDQITCGNQVHTFLQPQRTAKDVNDGSLVNFLEMAGMSALLTGDIGFDVEPYILSVLPKIPLDIYKSAHHGSRFSNSYEFLKSLDPTIAVVQAGVNNRFGHPSHEWVDITNRLGIPSLDTPSFGSIGFRVDWQGNRKIETMINQHMH